MTNKRLEELRKKFANSEGTNDDLGEILCDMFKSFSDHLKDLKNQVGKLEINQEIIFESIENLQSLLDPVYTIVQMDELLEEEEIAKGETTKEEKPIEEKE
jgi:predicted  nucleic acid-binding Zn-ribbon protein